MVVSVQFVQWLMVNVFNIVFQVWVFEMVKYFLDISCVFLWVKGVMFDQYCVVFFYCVLYDGMNFLVEDCVVNCLMVCQFFEVGGYSMFGV